MREASQQEVLLCHLYTHVLGGKKRNDINLLHEILRTEN